MKYWAFWMLTTIALAGVARPTDGAFVPHRATILASSARVIVPWQKPRGLSGWSRQAEVSRRDESSSDVPNSTSFQDCPVVTTQQRTLDLSSPREWLEHQHADGAYTVIRCDYHYQLPHQETAGDNWKIWGLNFHLGRLNDSLTSHAATERVSLHAFSLDQASQQSEAVIRELLTQATAALSITWNPAASETGLCVVTMITVLWYLDDTPENNRATVRVKAHVCTSGVVTNPATYAPDPVTVTLALPTDFYALAHLVNRIDSHPEAKLSSWCRQRRPLEEEFKRNGVGEVLLVDLVSDEHGNDAVNLLEGLTSNLFVVYPDRLLRTAAKGVLHGYARRLVLEYASQVGLTVDFAPIRLTEAHLWQEVFVTSSVKLIAPVESVLLPVTKDDGTQDFQRIWSRNAGSNPRCVWHEIYRLLQETLSDEL